MKDISLSILPIDAELLLEVMSQINCQGKEGAIQLLRIIHALENALGHSPKPKVTLSEPDDESS